MATATPSESVSARPSTEDWFFVGLVSSFPDITSHVSGKPYYKLAWPHPCSKAAPVPAHQDTTAASNTEAPKQDQPQQQTTPGCRVFHPRPAPAPAEEISIDAAPGEDAWAMREQVVVFRYEGKFHAVDHACPHRTFSMAWGRPFDIEDAARGGKVVGRAIRCGGHGYAFELSTGGGDRGGYELGVWEVEVRSGRSASVVGNGVGGVVLGGEEGEEDEHEAKEVWVRRKKKEA